MRVFPEIRKENLPPDALLQKYVASGDYTDCFVTDIDHPTSLAAFIEAFYTTAVFKAERLILNFVGRLSGIATLTRRYVDVVSTVSEARVYDTRKTTPGWRRLEKYAVRCGGGCNHEIKPGK